MKALFRVGQEVTWTGNAHGRPLRCTVVRVMPTENAVRTYRIQGLAERFERSVTEESLSETSRSEDDLVFDARPDVSP